MERISINGVELAYVVSGPADGTPLVLLHGNGGSHHDLDMLGARMAEAGYRVYALDSRGQGANEPLPEYHYADMAEDVFLFCESLGIGKPVIFGWSDGGIIALMMEMAHPGTASALAVSGANITVDGLSDAGGIAEFLSDASDPLVKLMLTEPDIDPATLSAIACPVLVTAGEHDVIREEHTRLIAASMPHSELRIIAGEDHGSYICNSPMIADILLDYLAGLGAEFADGMIYRLRP